MGLVKNFFQKGRALFCVTRMRWVMIFPVVPWVSDNWPWFLLCLSRWGHKSHWGQLLGISVYIGAFVLSPLPLVWSHMLIITPVRQSSCLGSSHMMGRSQHIVPEHLGASHPGTLWPRGQGPGDWEVDYIKLVIRQGWPLSALWVVSDTACLLTDTELTWGNGQNAIACGFTLFLFSPRKIKFLFMLSSYKWRIGVHADKH